jgi:hypothetical protein
VIDSGQLVNGLWMGIVLILLAFTPGLLDRCAEAMSRYSAALLFRLPFSRPTAASIHQPRWLAAAGIILILLSLLAHLAG